MTRTVKVHGGAKIALSDDDSGERDGLWLDAGTFSAFLTPRDVGRLIAALSRTQAARRDRRATPVGPREA